MVDSENDGENPVEEYLSTKTADVKKRREQELGYLQQWKQTKDPTHLEPLLKAYEPVLQQKIRQHKAPSIPESAFRAELTKHMIGAFESYDPNKGAQLNTHVMNRLRQAQRYNAKYQNTAHIPEGQIGLISPIQTAQNELTDQFGRPPTPQEIGEHIGKSPQFVNRVISSQRMDIPASKFESDPINKDLGRDQEVLSLLPYSLNAHEKKVFAHLYGDQKHSYPGSMGALAKQLGMSSSRLARIHSAILDKYKSYK